MMKKVGIKEKISIYLINKQIFIVRVVLSIIFLLLNYLLYADYPVIKILNSSDILFKQIQKDIQMYHLAMSSNNLDKVPELVIFQYQNTDSIDLFSLASRLNIPYDTLSSLNRIKNPAHFHELSVILIPNIPGIFLPVSVNSDLEQIMLSWRTRKKNTKELIIKINNKKEKYLFFPGDRFHSVERVYFLDSMFRMPIKKGRITSYYGKRKDPFSGHPVVHNGIDIGAPEDTEVFAAHSGMVKQIGFCDIYGKYILLSHAGGYQTFYGHLSEICVKLNMKVYSNTLIGRVGTTGRSTGPHLHFEIRRDGEFKDPVPFIQKSMK